MNKVKENQASVLHGLVRQQEFIRAHLYLENMKIPVDIQDSIIGRITKLRNLNHTNVVEIIQEIDFIGLTEKFRASKLQ